MLTEYAVWESEEAGIADFRVEPLNVWQCHSFMTGAGKMRVPEKGKGSLYIMVDKILKHQSV